ncbi:hypothetical protein HYW99_01495, partial [Candidatus Woesearchaeota archaeon]|nr:hypothetical protein [Candidatus Woesearchaeota archaeon]
TKGHRGLLFTGYYKNKKITIKIKNPKSNAIGNVENEAKWLKKLNKYNIGPKTLITNKDYFAYNYINGDFILDYIKKTDKSRIKKMIKQVFRQLYSLDKLKIDKEEMHHPYKHVIISKGKPYLIDFERMHYSQKPKNVTQFCQFLISEQVSEIFKNKRMYITKNNLINLAKVYKKNQNKSNLEKIFKII